MIKGNTEGKVIQKAKEHASNTHNIKPEDMSPEMHHKIMGLIRTTSSLRYYLIFSSFLSYSKGYIVIPYIYY